MARTIGITTAEDIATGLVEGHQLVGKLRIYEQGAEDEPLLSLPPEGIAQRFADEIQAVAGGETVDAIGMALASVGLLSPTLAAFIHVTSELAFILNSARLLPRTTQTAANAEVPLTSEPKSLAKAA